MRQWIKQPTIAILLAASLALAGVFVGYSVLAQGPDRVPPERTEGTAGKTGQILGLTPAQMPALQPEDLTVLYHFAGALNDDVTSTKKATVIQCSNLDEADTTEIEVQLFEFDASSVYTGTISVAPLRTATFESSPVPFYVADVLMGAGSVEQGYGRILTEHDNVACTVQTIDPDNSPPTWSFDIPLYSQPLHGALLPAIQRNATP